MRAFILCEFVTNKLGNSSAYLVHLYEWYKEAKVATDCDHCKDRTYNHLFRRQRRYPLHFASMLADKAERVYSLEKMAVEHRRIDCVSCERDEKGGGANSTGREENMFIVGYRTRGRDDRQRRIAFSPSLRLSLLCLVLAYTHSLLIWSIALLSKKNCKFIIFTLFSLHFLSNIWLRAIIVQEIVCWCENEYQRAWWPSGARRCRSFVGGQVRFRLRATKRTTQRSVNWE